MLTLILGFVSFVCWLITFIIGGALKATIGAVAIAVGLTGLALFAGFIPLLLAFAVVLAIPYLIAVAMVDVIF